MDRKLYYQVVSFVFLVIACLHFARALYGWEAIIGGVVIPVWVSWFAVILASYLAARGMQLSKKK